METLRCVKQVKSRSRIPLVTSAVEEPIFLRKVLLLYFISEVDEQNIAFISISGHCKYLALSYDLVNAPSVFQA